MRRLLPAGKIHIWSFELRLGQRNFIGVATLHRFTAQNGVIYFPDMRRRRNSKGRRRKFGVRKRRTCPYRSFCAPVRTVTNCYVRLQFKFKYFLSAESNKRRNTVSPRPMQKRFGGASNETILKQVNGNGLSLEGCVSKYGTPTKRL